MELTFEHSAHSDSATKMASGTDLVRRLLHGLHEHGSTGHKIAIAMLCARYEITAYKVGEVFPMEANPADHEKWFVAVTAGSDLTAMEFPPLAESESAALAVAVKHYNLAERYLAAH